MVNLFQNIILNELKPKITDLWKSENIINLAAPLTIRIKFEFKHTEDLNTLKNICEANEISLSKSLDVKDENNNLVGQLRSACFSPHFKKVIGIAMINKPFYEPSKNVKVDINGNICNGKVCDLPFI
mgnify:CR=1 FL=1